MLTTAPRPGAAAAFQGAELIGRFAVLSWDTAVGRVAMGYALSPAYSSPRALLAARWEKYGRKAAEHYQAVVVSDSVWGLDAPHLEACDLLPEDTGRPYKPSWAQLARLFGTEVPYWHGSLRDEKAILAWRPGAAAAVVAAQYPQTRAAEDALLRLAAYEPDGSPAGQVCLWLAREVHRRDTAAALSMLKSIHEDKSPFDGCKGLVVAARPAPLGR
ncbi:hypothetical protein BG452_04370 [Streptomyces sp. CBMA123]|nr:hypothetical protein [Streptomyces sp. CBMA123]